MLAKALLSKAARRGVRGASHALGRCFATPKTEAFIATLSQLHGAIREEIRFEESNFLDYKSLMPFFQEEGWTVEDPVKQPVFLMSKEVAPGIVATLRVHVETPDIRKEAEMEALENKFKEEIEQTEDEQRKEFLTSKYMELEEQRQYTVLGDLFLDSGKDTYVAIVIAFTKDKANVTDVKVVPGRVRDLLANAAKEEELNAVVSGFCNMQDKAQDAIKAFVASLGFGGKFATRVVQLSLAKDQELYCDFLNGFLEVVSPPPQAAISGRK